jgi:hypothetical protein
MGFWFLGSIHAPNVSANHGFANYVFDINYVFAKYVLAGSCSRESFWSLRVHLDSAASFPTFDNPTDP